jgi:ABC-type Na+ efflux pump permease subunit
MKAHLAHRLTPLAAIIRLTLIEAWRGRSARLLLLFLAAVYALGAFAASMAVTEGQETRLALAAHLYRLGLMLALALIVVSSTVRDMEGGFLQVLLAFPLSRAQFVIGRQAGYMLLTGLAAAAATGVMLTMAVPGGRIGVLAWGASLVRW